MGLTLEQRIENLARHYTILPQIESDGSSECPFAEKLFFKAQLAAKALEAAIEYERRQEKYEREEAEKKSGDQRVAWSSSARDREKAIKRAEFALRKAKRKQFPREPVNDYGKRVSEVPLPEYAESCQDYMMKHLMEGW